jgi:hypothetical protein
MTKTYPDRALGQFPQPSWFNGPQSDLHRLTAQVANVQEDTFAGGAIGDATADDAAALSAALTAVNSNGGGVVFLPPATAYRIATNITATLTAPLVLDLGGQTLRFVSGAKLTLQGAVQSALTLSVDAARGDTSITVTSATGVVAGDILDLSQATSAETTFGSSRRSLSVVRSVSGAVITLTAPLKIPFAAASTGIARYRHTTPLTVKNGNIEIVSPSTAQSTPLTLRYLRNPVFRDMRIFADQAWISGGPNGWGFDAGNMAGAQWSNITAEGLSYGISLQNCLASNINGYRARNVRHPVVPATWSVGVRVNNLTTENCYESIDSHAAFDVAYSNVFAARDETIPNLRCVGGSVVNATVYSDAQNADQAPQYHSLGLVDTTWYDTETLTLRDFRIITPARTNAAVGAVYGNIICTNVVAQMAAATTFNNTLKTVKLQNCRNPDGTPWTRAPFRIATRVLQPPNLPATLISSVYHIDAWATLSDQVGGVLRCYGRILENFATDPVAISIRIHDNVWPETDTPSKVYGVIKLRAMVQHANTGVFDILTKDFHFRHGISATSGVQFPLVAANTDGLTGQTNESLAITISNPTQAGVTELGTQADYYVQFDVSITSGRTSPLYNLTYDLELTRG